MKRSVHPKANIPWLFIIRFLFLAICLTCFSCSSVIKKSAIGPKQSEFLRYKKSSKSGFDLYVEQKDTFCTINKKTYSQRIQILYNQQLVELYTREDSDKIYCINRFHLRTETIFLDFTEHIDTSWVCKLGTVLTAEYKITFKNRVKDIYIFSFNCLSPVLSHDDVISQVWYNKKTKTIEKIEVISQNRDKYRESIFKRRGALSVRKDLILDTESYQDYQ